MAEYYIVAEENVNLIHDFTSPAVIKCEQYDGDHTRLIKLTVYNGDDKYTIPSNTTITVSGTKHDRTGFNYECTYSGSVITVPLMRQMTIFPGYLRCSITLVNSEKNQIGTAVFVLDIEKAALQTSTLESSNDFQAFKDYVDAAQYYKELARSYAVGGVGIRDNEDVDSGKQYYALSKYWSQIAESWAVGNTGLRDGENTNNSEYFANLAKQLLGAPWTANSLSDMTNRDRVYVYTGPNDSGLTSGNWYYFKDGVWVSGGVYNSLAIDVLYTVISNTEDISL